MPDTDEEIHAVRERLRRAVKAPTPGSGFWRQPATQWDVIKFVAPFLIAVALWAVRIEVNQARTDARFDAITVTLGQQSETLRGINSTLKEISDSRLQSRERLASIEAKMDILTQRMTK